MQSVEKGKSPAYELAARLFQEQEEVFRCPVCKKSMKARWKEGRLVCKNRHSFDLSKKGYVNFSGTGGIADYSKELFAARREIFSQGFYDPVTEELAQMIQSQPVQEDRPYRIVDVGCGEGFYSARLSQMDSLPSSCRFFACDLSRDAIGMAAGYRAPVCWCVADLTRLPFRNGRADLLLDILTPANYMEFQRVLKKGGILVKVVPGSGYLKEIREALSPRLLRKEYSNQEVADYFQAHFSLVEERTVCYQRPLTAKQSELFFRMTPMASQAVKPGEELPVLKEITIDFTILAGRA